MGREGGRGGGGEGWGRGGGREGGTDLGLPVQADEGNAQQQCDQDDAYHSDVVDPNTSECRFKISLLQYVCIHPITVQRNCIKV